jgi:pilus assembly protein CpaB
MSRRGRAIVLGALAILLGALAASDVAGREARLQRRLGHPVEVVVARTDLRAGSVLTPRLLALRRVPARYAPAAGFSSAREVSGLRVAVAVPAGTDLLPALLDGGAGGSPRDTLPAVRPGQRIAEIVARGSADLIAPGSRVDVLVTTETADGEGRTTLALQDAEVLSAAPAPAAAGHDEDAPRVALALRVTLRQAVTLAAAQNFARELRVLPRAVGDRGRLSPGWSVGSGR